MSSKYIGKTCPYCKTPLTENDAIAVCGVCDMPHHLSCWQDNKGCTTFGCSGTIKEIIGSNTDAAAAPVTAQPTPAPAKTAPAEQPEKPIETLYESKELVFIADVPIVLENTAIIIDRTKDKLFARCSFRSLTYKAMKAVLVEVTCQDVWGATLGEPVAHQYLDLNTARNTKFGQTDAVELADKTTRKIQVSVKKVLFADDSVVSGGDVAFTMAAPGLLSEHLGSDALAAEYARETSPKAKFVPTKADNYWLCTCGSINTDAEECCINCGCNYGQLTEALNPEALNTNMQSFEEAKRATAAREKAAQAERIRKAEEEVAREQRQKQAWLDYQQEQEQTKKKRKKRVLVAAISLVVIAALVCAIIFFFVPYMDYRAACDALEEGKYDTAYLTFKHMDGFLDSETMAKESLYQKAENALKNKQYDVAVYTYQGLGNYKDSQDKILEAKYCRAVDFKEKKDYKRAYQDFKALGQYKDSSDMITATILLWEVQALTSTSTSEAETFARMVTLSPSHYEMYYTTILLYANSHSDVDEWYYYPAADNMVTMLSLLPTSYEYTADLLTLFDCFADWEGHAKFFRENKAVMERLWALPLVQNLAATDDAMAYFMEGYWSNYSGYYYMSFYKSDSGGTSSLYNLPAASKPAGTKYYDFESQTYVWTDGSKTLAKVFYITIVDYDTIQVYSYRDGYTYTLYRN